MSSLVVDLIFRGSRLFYSWMASDALLKTGPVEVLTRAPHDSPLFRELFTDSKIDLSPVIPMDETFWYGKIPPAKITTLVDILAARDTAQDLRCIYFSGINEYWPELLEAMAIRLPAKTRAKPIVAVEYEGKTFLRNGADGISAAERAGLDGRKTAYARAMTAMPGLKIAVLDERAFDPKLADPLPPDRFFFLPDPLPDKAAESIGDTVAVADDFVTLGQGPAVLLVGVQSERKGLRDVIRALREPSLGEPEPRFFLSGRLEQPMEPLRPQIKALRERLAWRDDYVSEAAIRKSYAAADYVMMPYQRGFSGSSGVMAYATAFGKPIVSTDHGCIGYRVRRFGLGRTYKSGNTDELASLLRELPSATSDLYSEWRNNCLSYATSNSIQLHQATLVERLAPDDGGRVAGSRREDRAQKGAVKDRTADPAHKARPPAAASPSSLDIGHLVPASAEPRTIETVTETPLVALLDTAVSSLNMGDHIIMDAVRRHLRSVFPMAVFATMPTHDYLGSEAFKLLDQSSLAFVCGTNLLASNMDDYKQWKISGNELLRLHDLILCGVGWWQYQDDPNPYTQYFLNSALSKDYMHSVRDGYTLKKLRSVGINNVVNTSCVTMWSLSDEHVARVPFEKGENVLVTFTDYKPNEKADAEIFRILKASYKKVYLWIQGRSDSAYVRRVVDSSVELVGPTLASLDEALSSIDSLDYVGTRLHAGVRALQHGRRTLIVSVDNRATEIGKDTNLPVVERRDLSKLADRVRKAQPLRLTMPWDAIRTWISQFN
ncbi:MAG: polysaccharide pyruvyl transferase family protein [Propylenella sp.]